MVILWLYNESSELCVAIPPVWCGCLAHLVRRVCTTCADGMHIWCGWYAPHVRRDNTIAVYARAGI